MKVTGVIPARYGSTRFPGKPLAAIAGRPLLQWVIEAAQSAEALDEVIVATDDIRIADLASACGIEAVMTASDLPTGSDRVWAAIENRDCDIVVNIQGDEPLITGELLTYLAEPLLTSQDLEMATLGRELQAGDLENLNTAKIVMNQRQEALYFSRFPIPYSRMGMDALRRCCLKHIGLYAYQKAFLQRFCLQAPTDLERAESLEQLRALYLGARIKVVCVEHESWGVDTPEDVLKVEEKLRHRK